MITVTRPEEVNQHMKRLERRLTMVYDELNLLRSLLVAARELIDHDRAAGMQSNAVTDPDWHDLFIRLRDSVDVCKRAEL